MKKINYNPEFSCVIIFEEITMKKRMGIENEEDLEEEEWDEDEGLEEEEW